MRSILAFIFPIIISLNVFSQENYTYPELEVVPRASERVKGEYKNDGDNFFKYQWQYVLPSSITLVGGIMLMNNPSLTGNESADQLADKEDTAKQYGTLAAAIGAGWIGFSYFLNKYYQPYRGAMVKMKSIKGNSKKDELARERIAEEHMLNANELTRKLRWFNFGTNLTMSIAIAAKGDDEKVLPFGVLGIITSITPLIFPHYWEATYDSHMYYKKRIYGPVVRADFLHNTIDDTYFPGFTYSMRF